MWFDGPVTEAIAKAKKCNTVLIVFVYDADNEKSVSASNYWDNEDVQAACMENSCVALKFLNESTEARQFAEFYPLVSVPISFLISGDGIPLEIITDHVNAANLKERVLACVAKVKAQSTSSLVSKAGPSLQPKVDRAKEIIKQINEKKEKATQENEREKELKRRDEGRSLLSFREKQREMEILAAAEERKKDKIADKERLKLLREQIAADRAEKSERFQSACHQQEEEKQKKRQADEDIRKVSVQKQAAEMEQLHSKARIQFRLPDIPAVVEEFDSSHNFSTAYDFVSKAMHLQGEFRLIQMYPRREFTAPDSVKTFMELGLTPSAVLMVLRGDKFAGSSGLQQYQGNWMGYAFSLLFFPLLTVYNWLFSFVFPAKKNPDKQTAINRNVDGRPSASNVGRQEGSNIRRLNDDGSNANRKDDDDNATWNGNSTQQL